MTQLNWQESSTANGGPVWEARSAWQDDGWPFLYRWTWTTKGWLESSDRELMINEPRLFTSLAEAQAASQADFAADLASQLSDQIA